jgi:hypothetical protein
MTTWCESTLHPFHEIKSNLWHYKACLINDQHVHKETSYMVHSPYEEMIICQAVKIFTAISVPVFSSRIYTLHNAVRTKNILLHTKITLKIVDNNKSFIWNDIFSHF